MSHVLGIHHVTAIASDAQRNVDFYSGVLGLRLVKRTVNFDDPRTYHLYYGGETGTPGSIMTFFPWPGSRRGRQGPNQAVITSFAVLPSALGFWVERLLRQGVAYERPVKRSFGGEMESVITFRDPDGMVVEIVGHGGAEARPAWADAPGIARDQAIRGFHAVTLWLDASDSTERVLTETMGFRAVAESEGVRRYATGDGGPGTFIDVRAVGGFPEGVSGPGTVHHVAFRVPDDSAELSLRQQVIAAGLRPTEQIDRNYFRSVYFREPAGVLFELATDGPGFMIDEPVDRLGHALMLPERYEPIRTQIEARLPPIHLPAPPGAAQLLGANETPSG